MIRRTLSAVAITALVSIAAFAQGEIYRPGNGVTLPTVIKQVNPHYTDEAKAARIQGGVTLKVVVQADGDVGNVQVTQSLDTEYGLDNEAVKAAKQWKFKPGTKDGKPVAVEVSLELTFTLK